MGLKYMKTENQVDDAVKAEILENAPVLVAFHDVRHHIVWANKAYRQATGASLEQLRASKCYRAWGLSQSCRSCPVIKALKIGIPAEAELGPETQKHWPESQGSWLTKAMPLHDRKGRIIGAVEVALNITKRKKAEAYASEARERARHLEALASLYSRVQNMAESLDQEAVARETLRTSVEVLGAEVAWIGRLEEDGGVTVLARFPPAHPYPSLVSSGLTGSSGEPSPSGRAIQSGLPQLIDDINNESAYAAWHTVARKYGFRSVAALPLVSRGSLLGLLSLYSSQPGFFSLQRPEIYLTFAQQAASALKNARLFEENSRRLTRLNALRHIDMAITGSVDLRVTYMVALDEIASQLNVDAAAILRMNPHTGFLEYAAGRGFLTRSIENFSVQMGQGCAGRAAMERQIGHIANISEAGHSIAWADLLANEQFVSYHAAPMTAKGQLLGVLAVFRRDPQAEDKEWLEFFESLAAQVALAINNAILFDSLERRNMELLQAYDATIVGWARALSLKEEETEEHSKRVVAMTVKIAMAMGMSDDQIVHLRRGCLLHDIGKIGIPDAVLLKPGPLNDEEWAVMRRHPEHGFQMLAQILYLRPAIDIPYCHHEKWDGSGYPRGLKGEQIPLPARLFQVVDVWDALTRDRPYRKAWPDDEALAYIRAGSGKDFDPKIVAVFSDLIEKARE